MSKEKLLVAGMLNPWDLARAKAQYDLVELRRDMDPLTIAEQTREQVRACCTNSFGRTDGALMDLFPNLGVIANFGVGYDNIDVEAANARGIRVTNTPDVLTDDVADLTVGMMLAQARDIAGAQSWVRSGKWSSEGAYPLQFRMSGKRAGIVGLGRIGRAIADRLAAFGMPISYTSRAPKDTPGWRHFDDIAAMAAQVDYLVVALAGGPDTAGLVDAKVIAALGPEGVIVNISRGTTIDEAAMLDALENGRLRGAALDVFLNEPKLDPRFLNLKNVVLQPHQASATEETRRAMGGLMLDNIDAYFAGRPLLTPVN